jgi:hypothetical protein
MNLGLEKREYQILTVRSIGYEARKKENRAERAGKIFDSNFIVFNYACQQTVNNVILLFKRQQGSIQ